MNLHTDILMEFIKSAFGTTTLDIEKVKNIDNEALYQIYKTSKSHDLVQILAAELEKNGLLNNDELGNKFRKQQMIAIFRYEHINYELDRVCNVFQKERIPFVLLKGAIIRKHYPEPWMRTSCDIDILVHKEDVDNAANILVKECGYQNNGKSSHDISLFSPDQKTHVELHYDLVEDGVANGSSAILRSVWDNGVVCKDGQAMYEMTDEMFYFYHIAHMAKHFEVGGCGIKPFIDLWILDNMKDVDLDKRDHLLRKGDLLKFAEAVRKLSRVWLCGDEHDPVSQQMEDYILRGGVYGSQENRVTVQQQKKGGRLRYALSRIFLPYDVIKFHYPILQKYRFLTPFMEVRRWFKLVFCGAAKRSFHELNYNRNISDEIAAKTQEFLKNIGL
ncbi:MAG: hypothetical protein E7670_01175 [Ruminococcaceae bacterium]|nr:hypothetical protein [Oscillospiraceae bacterium]